MIPGFGHNIQASVVPSVVDEITTTAAQAERVP